MYRSVDSGATWSAITDGLPIDPATGSVFEIHALTIDPRNPNVLYVATFGGGLYTSSTGGASWSEFDSGLTDSYLHALAFAFDRASSTMTLYAGSCNEGVFFVVP